MFKIFVLFFLLSISRAIIKYGVYDNCVCPDEDSTKTDNIPTGSLENYTYEIL